MQSMSFSFLTCFDDVSDDTKLWNPDTAPHAIVINKVGNKLGQVNDFCEKKYMENVVK